MRLFLDTANIDASTDAVHAGVLTGSHTATIRYGALRAMIKHPLTDTGIERFFIDSAEYASV